MSRKYTESNYESGFINNEIVPQMAKFRQEKFKNMDNFMLQSNRILSELEVHNLKKRTLRKTESA